MSTMQAIKLTISGEYWDSQLYDGSLYLFGYSGDLVVIDWNSLITDTLSEDSHLKMAAHTAFIESNIFYQKGVQLLLQDEEIKETLLERFHTLADLNVQIDLEKAKKFVSRQDNPLPFPHADSEFYYKTLYVSLKDGVFFSKREGKGIKKEANQVWDTPTLDITASKLYTTIAFAAGDEGLFQQRIDTRNGTERDKRTPRLVSKKHCTSCRWADFNIYATSHVDSSFFASFKKRKTEGSKEKYERHFEKVISADEIFGGRGFSWGVQDKLYIYRGNGIDAVKYSAKKDGSPDFQDIGRLHLHQWKGEVVSAEVAPFGTVIECENAIIVIQSNAELSTADNVFTIPGEPVNWRVFSKSSNYTNQLHIIYDDRLEIFSFYNDYFVNQGNKISGIAMKSN